MVQISMSVEIAMSERKSAGIKVFEWCPIADSKTLSQTQMVSNTQN